ncbi:hypothetical protein [Spirosoma radiotolerans]|uniref:Uncharacterized protein n=1 Tax=Spirosoma radiotolerans TaxID=1379870 RepID=A0A0E3ZU52_9BACT|nr:hypothetical protein [Spirosoma radiotolerans]AKD54368.1 hypothetical protein SD10_05020 [Spirosoma radiotolerans]
MRTLIDAIEHEKWTVNDWRVQFILSEKQLHLIKKLSPIEDWYENQSVIDDWMVKLDVCFFNLEKFYDAFGYLPQYGDRLSDEDLGLMIQERAIDGSSKTITFVLSS